jgi:hypothetical protein
MKMIVIILLFILALPVLAQPPPDTISTIVSLQEITITAKTGFDRDRQASPAHRSKNTSRRPKKSG